MLYQFPNALAAFVGANGINILVKRIKDEVDDCVNDQVQPSFPEGGGGMVADYMEGLIKEDKEGNFKKDNQCLFFTYRTST